jgi:hypothetical protein
MSVNDTLKFRSYGWKQDMTAKVPHIQRLSDRNEQYYPPDKEGVVDEWKALLAQQAEMNRIETEKEKQAHKKSKLDYKRALDQQMRQKQQSDFVEGMTRQQEQETMAANAAYASSMNNQAQLQGKHVQRYLGNHYEHDMMRRRQ